MIILDYSSMTLELYFSGHEILEDNPQMNQREPSKSLGVSLGASLPFKFLGSQRLHQNTEL